MCQLLTDADLTDAALQLRDSDQPAPLHAHATTRSPAPARRLRIPAQPSERASPSTQRVAERHLNLPVPSPAATRLDHTQSAEPQAMINTPRRSSAKNQLSSYSEATSLRGPECVVSAGHVLLASGRSLVRTARRPDHPVLIAMSRQARPNGMSEAPAITHAVSQGPPPPGSGAVRAASAGQSPTRRARRRRRPCPR